MEHPFREMQSRAIPLGEVAKILTLYENSSELNYESICRIGKLPINVPPVYYTSKEGFSVTSRALAALQQVILGLLKENERLRSQREYLHHAWRREHMQVNNYRVECSRYRKRIVELEAGSSYSTRKSSSSEMLFSHQRDHPYIPSKLNADLHWCPDCHRSYPSEHALCSHIRKRHTKGPQTRHQAFDPKCLASSVGSAPSQPSMNTSPLKQHAPQCEILDREKQNTALSSADVVNLQQELQKTLQVVNTVLLEQQSHLKHIKSTEKENFSAEQLREELESFKAGLETITHRLCELEARPILGAPAPKSVYVDSTAAGIAAAAFQSTPSALPLPFSNPEVGAHDGRIERPSAAATLGGSIPIEVHSPAPVLPPTSFVAPKVLPNEAISMLPSIALKQPVVVASVEKGPSSNTASQPVKEEHPPPSLRPFNQVVSDAMNPFPTPSPSSTTGIEGTASTAPVGIQEPHSLEGAATVISGMKMKAEHSPLFCASSHYPSSNDGLSVSTLPFVSGSSNTIHISSLPAVTPATTPSTNTSVAQGGPPSTEGQTRPLTTVEAILQSTRDVVQAASVKPTIQTKMETPPPAEGVAQVSVPVVIPPPCLPVAIQREAALSPQLSQEAERTAEADVHDPLVKDLNGHEALLVEPPIANPCQEEKNIDKENTDSDSYSYYYTYSESSDSDAGDEEKKGVFDEGKSEKSAA